MADILLSVVDKFFLLLCFASPQGPGGSASILSWTANAKQVNGHDKEAK